MRTVTPDLRSRGPRNPCEVVPTPVCQGPTLAIPTVYSGSRPGKQPSYTRDPLWLLRYSILSWFCVRAENSLYGFREAKTFGRVLNNFHIFLKLLACVYHEYCATRFYRKESRANASFCSRVRTVVDLASSWEWNSQQQQLSRFSRSKSQLRRFSPPKSRR